MEDLISRKALLEEIKDFRMTITGFKNEMATTIMDEMKKSIMQIIEEQPTIVTDVYQHMEREGKTDGEGAGEKTGKKDLFRCTE